MNQYSYEAGYMDRIEQVLDDLTAEEYNFGYAEGKVDALEEHDCDDSFAVWLESLRRQGINILEPFCCRWDAAEQKLVVEQKNTLEKILECTNSNEMYNLAWNALHPEDPL